MSKREVLRLMLALPTLAVGLRPLLAGAQSIEALKQEYHYRQYPMGRKGCMGCANYAAVSRVAGNCSVLQTRVNWEGWCTSWTPKAK